MFVIVLADGSNLTSSGSCASSWAVSGLVTTGGDCGGSSSISCKVDEIILLCDTVRRRE